MPLPYADRPIPTAADLERFLPVVVSALAGATQQPEELYALGKPWTRRTLAWHIVDTEAAMANRLCRILAEDRPVLVGIPQDVWATGLPQRRNPLIAAAWFQTTRAMVVDLLHDLPAGAWERTGTHSEYGAMRFADVLRHLHEHALHHADHLAASGPVLPLPDFTLRRATVADAAELATLNHRLIRDEGHANAMTVAELTGRMVGWLAGPYAAWLATQAGGTIGYCLARDDGDAIYIRQLYVAPSARRHGVGKKIIDRLGASALDGRTLRLECLLVNPAGLAFWRSTGFADYCLTLVRRSPQPIPEAEHEP
jgi:GNAT superfamily N-acetyltransferase